LDARSALPSHRRLTVLVAVLAAVLSGLAWPAEAQSLGEVRERRAELQERLDRAAEELDRIESERALLEDEAAGLDDELGALRSEVAFARERMASRVRSLYMYGSTDPVVVMLSGSDPSDALERATTVRQLVGADRRESERAASAGVRVEAVATRLADARAQLDDAAARQRELTDGLQDDLAEAQALEDRLEAEERRRREEEARREAARRAAAERSARTSTPAPSSGSAPSGGGGKACPMAKPHSFTDTWGAPRSGGRSHRGTDILAPRGQRVLAIVDGVWDIYPPGASAGLWAILRGDDGNHYWYLHLESHQVGDRARVRAGQLVATNGDTGNARGTTPHVHFELHPGGGGAVNPYPTLKRLCG
jgi:septal ring factor EnvC (AmiA/AmiB activator)